MHGKSLEGNLKSQIIIYEEGLLLHMKSLAMAQYRFSYIILIDQKILYKQAF